MCAKWATRRGVRPLRGSKNVKIRCWNRNVYNPLWGLQYLSIIDLQISKHILNPQSNLYHRKKNKAGIKHSKPSASVLSKIQKSSLAQTVSKISNMDKKKDLRERNNAAAKRFRDRKKQEEQDIAKMYKQNEERLAHLERVADQLSAQLRKNWAMRVQTTARVLLQNYLFILLFSRRRLAHEWAGKQSLAVGAYEKVWAWCPKEQNRLRSKSSGLYKFGGRGEMKWDQKIYLYTKRGYVLFSYARWEMISIDVWILILFKAPGDKFM